MLLDTQQFERMNRLDSAIRQPKLLNIGCGTHFHTDWINLDLISESLNVIPHDVSCGLPFPGNEFDAIYHSHVLEHLNPETGINLIEECFRVLKPGGILRIVVPDLELIAKLYLEKHDRAWAGDETARVDYDWMKLELLDQLVRNQSGGQMGQYMSDPKIRNSDFVRSRVGDEYNVCTSSSAEPCSKSATKSVIRKIGDSTRAVREAVARKIVRLLLGPGAEVALGEGLFRNSGEVHRWMYDRYSLRDACDKIGFVDFQILSADSSQIRKFEKFELDVVGGEIRKPDSLFTECRKPLRA